MIHTVHFRCVAMAGVALSMLLISAPLVAQEARDPTVAPSETGSGGLLPKAVEGMSVLVRGDQSFLVVGTRLYAPGDTVGNLRVERITETEVWLHDGNALIKVPRFAGITRKTIPVKPLCSALPPPADGAPSATAATASVAGKPTKARKRAKPNTPPVAPNPPAPAAACEDTPS
jgi:hypothetical protein